MCGMRKAGYKVDQLCRCLNASRTSFYRRLKSKPIDIQRIQLIANIRYIHHKMDATYGSRRMQCELAERGFKLSRYRIRKLMNELDLIAKRPKSHHYPVGKVSIIAKNHLNRQFNPQQANQCWAGDMTYIRTHQGWLYLAVVMDLYSRRIISWAFSDKPNSALTTKVLRLAIQKRNPQNQLIFHSDQGSQYSSDAFQTCLNQHNIIPSMSRKGNCLDNAVIERFFRSLKSERVKYRHYLTRHQAIVDIIDYIEPFYNQIRRHSHLGNVSPNQYKSKALKTA